MTNKQASSTITLPPPEKVPGTPLTDEFFYIVRDFPYYKTVSVSILKEYQMATRMKPMEILRAAA